MNFNNVSKLYYVDFECCSDNGAVKVRHFYNLASQYLYTRYTDSAGVKYGQAPAGLDCACGVIIPADPYNEPNHFLTNNRTDLRTTTPGLFEVSFEDTTSGNNGTHTIDFGDGSAVVVINGLLNYTHTYPTSNLTNTYPVVYTYENGLTGHFAKVQINVIIDGAGSYTNNETLGSSFNQLVLPGTPTINAEYWTYAPNTNRRFEQTINGDITSSYVAPFGWNTTLLRCDNLQVGINIVTRKVYDNTSNILLYTIEQTLHYSPN